LQQLKPPGHFLELVHRLDQGTSGCLLFAKKITVLRELHALLRTSAIEKTYLALVKGYWPQHLHEIGVPLQKQHLHSGEWSVKINSTGKPALTQFQIVTRFTESTLVKVKPKTGRTHQIRVHAQYSQHPIAGDAKYGEKAFNRTIQRLGCNRLFLHASELKFHLPSSEPIHVKAGLTEDLSTVLQQLILLK